MVGIQRVLEGTDWPVCSAVYCVGMPGSLNTVVQLLGRAMRLKGEDYPAGQRDRARLVFFVPCGGGAALADLSIDHSRHALLTCCFLADHEVGQEWIVLHDVRRGIEAALGTRTENTAAADAENEADEPLGPEVRAEVELVMAVAREQIVSSGGEVTVGEVMRVAAKTRPDLPEAALHRVAAEILAAQTTSGGAAVRQAIQQEIATRLRIDPMVKKAMGEAFAVVLEEFRDVTLQESAVLESVRRQIHGVTGGQMREFARRLRDAVPRPLTEEMILEWADSHFERLGRWPRVESGEIVGAPGEKWANVNACLQQGLRGLSGGSSLVKLLAEQRGARNMADLPPLEIEQILARADAHHKRMNKWPSTESGQVHDAPCETWANLNTHLVKGLRGLPGGCSLAKLLDEHRGKRNKKDLPPLRIEHILTWADKHHQRNMAACPSLSLDQILSWADAHRDCTGSWPTQNSGVVQAAVDERWGNIDVALHEGHRGLPGGSSLAKLLAEHRGARNRLDLPSLSNDQILAWADAHREQTGRWPTKEAGAVDGVPEESWSGINAALRRGIRGLAGESSLAKLLAERRRVKNHGDLPPLSVDEILEWADSHFERIDEWPGQDSGPVLGANDLTWRAVHLALYKGGRGLPGGSSLAKLLAEHRSVRNSVDLSSLTVGQVLAWADEHHKRMGEWPKVKSGPVHEGPGETWNGIEQALRTGRRGLPGGSSLTKLLAQHRDVRNPKELPDLTINQVLTWADIYRKHTSEWPSQYSGPVDGSPGESWAGINTALRRGSRGLPSGLSLAKLECQHTQNEYSIGK